MPSNFMPLTDLNIHVNPRPSKLLSPVSTLQDQLIAT